MASNIFVQTTIVKRKISGSPGAAKALLGDSLRRLSGQCSERNAAEEKRDFSLRSE